MRVTNIMIGNSLIRHINSNLNNLSRTHEQLSTGKTILRPSDNPTDISQLLAIKAQKEINKQYTKNINDGLAYLYTADAALGTLGDIVSQANAMGVQGANGTLAQEDMQALAMQIDKMIDQVVDIANVTVGGKYLFAGKTNDKPPFIRFEGQDVIVYQGDLDRIYREIANLSEHTVDAPGVLDNSSGSMGVFGNVNGAELEGDKAAKVSGGLFDALFALRDALYSGNHEAVDSMLGEMQSQLDNVLQHRVTVGARTRHFEAIKDQMIDQEIRLEQVEENLHSADIARLTIDLSQQQLVYQTALASGATILQVSLLNFLK
ncbi:MAG: flagellar hook-associated protein FlgL [Firmicutes bacterium]|nr:flagellar hook-associated protein FlgL [Bacillota bacterium]